MPPGFGLVLWLESNAEPSYFFAVAQVARIDKA